ncbi:MAG TPA: heme-binding protein [Phycisphaerae bacterium]|nr:heme-binding protein [Phycisphaerae bacterium]
MIQYRTVSVADARRAVRAVVAEMEKRGVAGVVAVADRNGELLVLERLDGAAVSAVTIATNKAYTAAREGKTTRSIGEESRDGVKGFDLQNFGSGRHVGWGGGVPVVMEGEVVGAVGVSGLPEAVDMELAEIGVRAAV